MHCHYHPPDRPPGPRCRANRPVSITPAPNLASYRFDSDRNSSSSSEPGPPAMRLKIPHLLLGFLTGVISGLVLGILIAKKIYEDGEILLISSSSHHIPSNHTSQIDLSKKEQARMYHLLENAQAARSRAAAPSEYGSFRRENSPIETMHPKLVGMDDRFVARDEWNNNNINSNSNNETGVAYPNIEIVGLPKAGTSHLYSILSNRPDTVKFHPTNKELCSGALYGGKSNEETQQALFEFHEKTFRENRERIQTAEAKKLLSVNSCIWVEDAILRHSYLRLGGSGKQKLVVLFRDPADWMWAAWNFWTDPSQDINLGTGAWTNKSVNYRSPELFHEIFSAGDAKTKQFPNRFELFRRLSVQGVQTLWEAMGKENILFLKSEEMRPDVVNVTGGFLDKLSTFTGLDRSLFSDRIFQYSNCNDSKGADSNCGEVSSTAYDIAGGREMLPETRELVYLYFWEECKIWSKEFGVHYPDCVNVLSKIPTVLA